MKCQVCGREMEPCKPPWVASRLKDVFNYFWCIACWHLRSELKPSEPHQVIAEAYPQEPWCACCNRPQSRCLKGGEV
jgi:hypothetical protein